ncbi:uncharacterized protein L3040_009019 [Drepanopeziza brunnea f. sp. 'multigermtubi']|uniref:uncharacterized protein n=1 Tax=Drepanopeziza brunnea f. sp. 'multigermtubi' TaxID=698441 RepID=UPI00238516DF|nr:hypothetical protein L3040_009019 [Drepanopeziza brunnea f. sp. 'multigermtubi']
MMLGSRSTIDMIDTIDNHHGRPIPRLDCSPVTRHEILGVLGARGTAYRQELYLLSSGPSQKLRVLAPARAQCPMPNKTFLLHHVREPASDAHQHATPTVNAVAHRK